MIPGNPNGQVWIAKEIRKVEPVARTSLIYPTYISEGMEATSTVDSFLLYLVNRYQYLGNQLPEFGQVEFNTQSIVLRTSPTLSLLPEYGAVTAKMTTEGEDGVAGIKIRTSPVLSVPKESGEVSAIFIGYQYGRSITIPVKNEHGSVTFEITGIELTT